MPRPLPVLPTVDTLAAVRDAQAALDDAVDQMAQAVELARLDGHTWRLIGETLDITPQAAQQRFGRSLVRL